VRRKFIEKKKKERKKNEMKKRVSEKQAVWSIRHKKEEEEGEGVRRLVFLSSREKTRVRG